MEKLEALDNLLDRALKEAKATESVVEAIRDELKRSRGAVERLLRFKEEVGVQHEVAIDTDVKVEGGRDIWKDTLTAEEFGASSETKLEFVAKSTAFLGSRESKKGLDVTFTIPASWTF